MFEQSDRHSDKIKRLADLRMSIIEGRAFGADDALTLIDILVGVEIHQREAGPVNNTPPVTEPNGDPDGTPV